jgi:hypothetical protein
MTDERFDLSEVIFIIPRDSDFLIGVRILKDRHGPNMHETDRGPWSLC